jgi:pimeloyl-ACP methyl ester carboxylesterase
MFMFVKTLFYIMKKYCLILLFLLISALSFAQNQHATFVIVHGAWGGSWAFKETDSLLTKLGNTVYRPSLTGQGERVHLASENINLTTHINDVVNMILFEDLNDIVLVGHSYGGMVITGVSDRLPDKIRKLIYLDAFVPNDGESLKSIQGEAFESMMKFNQNGFLVPPWVDASQEPPKDVPHPLKTLTEPVSLKNPKAKNLPAVYILTVDPGKKPEEDGFFAQAQRAKQRGWKILEMDADHNPQRTKVKELVELLEDNKN